MSHFAAIGLTATNQDDFGDHCIRAATLAIPEPSSNLHSLYCDESGGALAIHTNDRGAIDCITPFFVSPKPTTWRVRTTAPAPDDSCAHCSGADCDVLDGPNGEVITRASIQWLFFAPYAQWLRDPHEYDLEVVAFAHRLTLSATTEGLARAQTEAFADVTPSASGRPFRLADTAFIPTGMFGPVSDMSERATALLTGTVDSIHIRKSTLGGADFAHLHITTLPGPLDLVAPADFLDANAGEARHLMASVWLVGRPTEPPPAPPKSWWSRLVGR